MRSRAGLGLLNYRGGVNVGGAAANYAGEREQGEQNRYERPELTGIAGNQQAARKLAKVGVLQQALFNGRAWVGCLLRGGQVTREALALLRCPEGNDGACLVNESVGAIRDASYAAASGAWSRPDVRDLGGGSWPKRDPGREDRAARVADRWELLSSRQGGDHTGSLGLVAT